MIDQKFLQSEYGKSEYGSAWQMQGDDPGRSSPADDHLAQILTRPKIAPPSRYQVVLLNDDYTPMDFVVYVLMRFFEKSSDEAVTLMLRVHEQGRALCGVYTYEIAETKVVQVMELAREEKHPLRCMMEKKP